MSRDQSPPPGNGADAEVWKRRLQLAVRGARTLLIYWLHPSSYRPLYLLVALSMAVFLGPLAFDVAHALFFRIPPWIRNGLVQGLLLSLIAAGVWRLWQVRTTDRWIVDDEVEGRSASDRLVPWALRLAVASLAMPLMQNPDGFGFADWDFVLDKFEALRRTILIWRQFPWWNPWSRGGFPLAAEPQIGAVSLATPLVLTLGSGIGLRVAALIFVWLAVEGAYWLARLWFREPWAAAAAALIYGLNGAVIMSTSLGYVLAMSYCSVPWLAYFAFRIGRRLSDGIWLGFWMAFVVMNGLQYVSLYAAPITAMIWLRALRLQPAGRRFALIRHTVAAFGVFFLLCGWRLITVFLVLLEDRRERVTFWDETPLSLLQSLLARPSPHWTEYFSDVAGSVYAELTCYVGPVVLVLALVSLARGWRWWHTLALVCFWLCMGSVQWYHPSAWMAHWPFFSSAHVVIRWHFMAFLGLGFAAGSAVARWRASPSRGLRTVAALLVVIIAVDFVVLGHQQLWRAFRVRPDPELFPGPPVPDIVNVRDGLGYPCAMRGYGIIRGYEPMLSYYRDAPTLRRAREDNDYRGEAWTARGTVRPLLWTPNRLVFQVGPREEVHINQNPGSWWWANGRQAFPDLRCAELNRPFAVRADEHGRLVLEIRPRGLEVGVGVHILGLILIVASVLLGGRRRTIA